MGAGVVTTSVVGVGLGAGVGSEGAVGGGVSFIGSGEAEGSVLPLKPGVGDAVGIGVGVGVAVGDTVGVAVGLALGVGLGVGLAVGVGVGLASLTLPLTPEVGVGEAVRFIVTVMPSPSTSQPIAPNRRVEPRTIEALSL